MKNEMKNIIDHAAAVFFLGAIVVGSAKGSILPVLVGGIFLIMIYLIRIENMCSGIEASKKKHDDYDKISATFTSDDRLKECPFCHGKAWLEHIEFTDGDVWYNPQCSECSCGWTKNYEIIEEAIEDWNKRMVKYDSKNPCLSCNPKDTYACEQRGSVCKERQEYMKLIR